MYLIVNLLDSLFGDLCTNASVLPVLSPPRLLYRLLLDAADINRLPQKFFYPEIYHFNVRKIRFHPLSSTSESRV